MSDRQIARGLCLHLLAIHHRQLDFTEVARRHGVDHLLPFGANRLERGIGCLLGAESDKATFYLVQLEPGANVETVRQELRNRLEGAEVLTKNEFEDRSLRQWLFRTGAGLALIGPFWFGRDQAKL